MPDPNLVQALTTYSSLLFSLTVLPPTLTSKIYRRIVSHLSNHIVQRVVYAGWSKFSPQGGKDFSDEVKDWIETSSTAVGGVVIGGQVAVEAHGRT